MFRCLPVFPLKKRRMYVGYRVTGQCKVRTCSSTGITMLACVLKVETPRVQARNTPIGYSMFSGPFSVSGCAVTVIVFDTI